MYMTNNACELHTEKVLKPSISVVGDDSTLWHKILGHASMKVILKLISKALVRNFPKLDYAYHSCNVCKLGNQVHASQKSNNDNISSIRVLELVHLGLFGP